MADDTFDLLIITFLNITNSLPMLTPPQFKVKSDNPQLLSGKVKISLATGGGALALAFFSFFNTEMLAQTNTFPLNGNVGIGTLTPQSTLEVRGNIIAVDEQAILGNRGVVAYQNNNGIHAALFSGYKSRGTHLFPLPVQSGDYGFAYANTFYGSGQYINSGALAFSVDGTPIGNSIPSQVEIITSTTGGDGVSNYGQTRLIIKSDGKVGIGTTTPSQNLEVAGTIYSTSGGFKFPDGSVQTTAFDENAIDATGWKLDGNAATLPGLDFLGTTDVQALVIKTNNAERIRIAANGKVGIGTSNPLAPLHIASSGATDNCGTIFRIQHTNISPPNGCAIGPFDVSWDFKTSQHNAFEMGLANTTPVLILKSSDYNVGAPALQVNGSLSIFDGNGNTSLFFGQDLIPSNTYGKWGIQYVAAGQLGAGMPGGMNFWIPTVGGNTSPGDAKFFIADNGNVGIGESNPVSRLHIATTSDLDKAFSVYSGGNENFLVYGDGFVFARRFEVAVSAFVHPPDYVFEKNYTFLSIEELRKFIDKNKHLPNFPSAQELKKNGKYDLLEMDMNLLKTTEELTLYIIKQQNEIEALKRMVDLLRKDMEVLKKK